MTDTVYLNHLREQRANTWEQAKALLDVAGQYNRDLTAEEQVTFDRLNSELDMIDERVKSIEDAEQRQRDTEAAFEKLLGQPAGAPGARGSVDPSLDEAFRNAVLRRDPTPIVVRMAEARSGYQPGIERRNLTSTGFTPTSFWGTLERHLVEGSAILAAGATLVTTESGETLKVPKSTALSAASIIGEAAAIDESDPTLDSATLRAYKYAFLVSVTRELAEDSTFDLAGFLAQQAGEALANGAGAHFVTGTGSSQPTGVVSSATTGVTGGTGVTGAFTADNLIDLYHSVAEPYARSSSAAWLMRNTTLGAVRKLKDSQDRYLFDINAPAGSGASGSLLGRPVYVDPNVAAVGTGAKSVLFGDFSRYWVRSVRGVQFESSTDYQFNKDMTTFRAIWRTDGVLVDQTGAVKCFVGAAS